MSIEVPESPLAASMVGLLTGGWVAQAVSVAARLKIADQLAHGPRSAADIAEAVDAHAPTLHRLLRALSDVGVVQEREDGLFSGTPLGELLRSDVPSLRGYALLTGAPFHRAAWDALEHSVRTGEPSFPHVHGQEIFDYLRDNPSDGDVLNEAMVAMSGEFIAPVAAACEFPPGHTIVDVGGGHGALLARILAAHPKSNGVLFDLPHVIEGAGEPLARAGVMDRCVLMGGDFFTMVPPGGDAYLLCNIVHDWGDDDAARILANCRKAMTGEGRVLLVEAVIPDPPREPAAATVIDLEMLVIARGARQRTASEFAELFGRAGLRLTGVNGDGVFNMVEAAPV